MASKSPPFTEEELNQLWALFGGDQRFGPLQYSHATRIAAYENVSRAVAEIKWLRTGEWIDDAAREIGARVERGLLSASPASDVAGIIRRHLSGAE